MPNPYEKFVTAPTTPGASTNPYDAFTEPGATPIDVAIARRQDEVAAYQEDFSKRRTEFASELEARYGDQLPGDPARLPNEGPGYDPYAHLRRPPIPAPEPAMGKRFGTAVKLGLVDDEETKRRILAENLFPGDPDGINRVGIVEGQPVYVDDSGNLRRVTTMPQSFGANLIANSPELVGGGVGSLAGVVGAGLGAAGAHGIKRGIAGLVFDEPQTIPENLAGMGTEGAAAGLGAGVGRAMAAYGNRGRLFDLSPEELAEAERVIARVKATTGVDLDLAQATGDAALIATRAYLARYPGKTAQMFKVAERAANGQFDDATRDMMDLIASSTPSEVAGAEGMNAARLAIQHAQRMVSNRARPFYEAAYNAKPEVTEERILRFLDLPYFMDAYKRGQILAALEGKTVKPYTPTTLPVPSKDGPLPPRPGGGPDLRALDYLKQGLDAVIEELQVTNPSMARALRAQKNAFVKELDTVTPEYARARQVYGQLMKARVEPLENGAIGVLARLKDPQAARAAAKIFSDPNISPEQIAFTKQVIESQNPQAWRQLVRSWVGQKYGNALKITQKGETLNPAGKFRQAVAGTPSDLARLEAMLPAEARDMFDEIMYVAERLARTPIAGSSTPADLEVKQGLKTAGVGTVATMFRWLTSPRQTILDATERAALQRNGVAITEALLDPLKRRQLRSILRMQPSTEQALLLSNVLAAETGLVGLDTAFPRGEDIGGFAPPEKEEEAPPPPKDEGDAFSLGSWIYDLAHGADE